MTSGLTMKAALVGAFAAAAVSVTTAQQPVSFLEQGGRQAGRQMQQPQGPPQGQPQNPNPGGNQGPKNPGPNDPMSPVYIQQMFDAMAVMEAERFLPLAADQYPTFVQKLRRLQEAKMQSNRRRTKALNELRALSGPQAQPDVPESLIDAKLKELAAAEIEGAANVRKALDDLDVGLSVRQRARYRLLEENVERRKIDFLTKVRGGGPGLEFEGIPR
jgi:hypothetical protein